MKKLSYILLLIIIGLGFFLRVYRLSDRGPADHDEGYYLLQTQQLKERPLFSLPACQAKPGHISLISLMSLIIGLEDYTSLVVSAIFGILTIFLIYAVGRQMYSIETGLWAAFLIAISPYHLYYSRSGYSFTSALFFYILGIYLYYLSHVGRTHKSLKLFAGGVSIGFAITCHHTFFWLWPVLPAYELFLNRFTPPDSEHLTGFTKRKIVKRRLSILIFSLLLPGMIFEGLVRISNLINPGTDNDGFAYFPQLRRLFARFMPIIARFDAGENNNFSFFDINTQAIASYFRFLWRLEGPLVCLLFVAGIIIIFIRLRRKFRLKDFIILTQVLIPLFIWFAHAFFCNILRVKALFVLLPGMALIVGRTIVGLKDFISKRAGDGFVFQLFSTILISALVIYPVTNELREILSIRNSFKQATYELAEYLKDTPSTIAINPLSFPIWHFYFRQHNIRDFYPYRDGWPIREGLFITDYVTWRTLDDKIIWRSRQITVKKLLNILEEETAPIVNLPYFRGDDFLDRALKPDFGHNKTLEYLKIYDLRKLTYGSLQ